MRNVVVVAGLFVVGWRRAGGRRAARFFEGTDAGTDAQLDGGGADPGACGPEDTCVRVPRGCCERRGLRGHPPDDLRSAAHAVRGDVCPLCPSLGGRSNIGARCEAGRCKVFDARREKPLSACTEDDDCLLRFGLACCESCDAASIVAVRKDAAIERLVCPKERDRSSAVPGARRSSRWVRARRARRASAPWSTRVSGRLALALPARTPQARVRRAASRGPGRPSAPRSLSRAR